MQSPHHLQQHLQQPLQQTLQPSNYDTAATTASIFSSSTIPSYQPLPNTFAFTHPGSGGTNTINPSAYTSSSSANTIAGQPSFHTTTSFPAFDTNIYSTGAASSASPFSYPNKIPDYSPGTNIAQATKPQDPTSHLLASAAKQHQKNNLSISSHFNLFSLSEEHSLPGGILKKEAAPPNDAAIANELIVSLSSVDGSNINNYLLTLLNRLALPFPVDDFYNLLYNNDRFDPQLDSSLKIDRTVVTKNNDLVIRTITQLLNIFKRPDLLGEYFPNMEDKENKLVNINYHELLRSFLAIKILYDMLVQLPLSSDDDPQNYTIPRLSIYKTYYILCQKLIVTYPSSSNTTNEQQKLILGQSKLGKLIKLVYPNLLIKRLGSRGESKYNYLGVIWNDNIISDEIKNLCEKNELVELGEIFKGEQQSGQRSSASAPKKTHRRLSSKGKNRFEASGSHGGLTTGMSSANAPPVATTTNIFSPSLSFMKPYLRFPSDDSFTLLNEEENWFSEMRLRIYSSSSLISQELIHNVFLTSSNLTSNSSLLHNLMERIVKPMEASTSDTSTDLHLYFIILVEILPYFALVKRTTHLSFLKTLKHNLLHLINNFNGELRAINARKFSLNNSTIFLVLIKKLLNLNDLLITFLKLIIRDNTKSIMAVDIENFLKVTNSVTPSQGTVKLEDSSQDDDAFFLNLNANLTTSSLGEINFNFKNDILSNDLVYALIGYNFDPALFQELKQSISMNFVNEEITIIDDFFKKDLFAFLNDTNFDTESLDASTSSISHSDSEETKSGEAGEPILSSKEFSKLYSLLALIDKKLLAQHYKDKYPILIYNNFVSYILNDVLKYIFLKRQQAQIQSLQSNSTETELSQNSFGNWWVFNSFIQEYLSLMGEIVGLNDLVS
ncbi:uncharacterized protein RJT20DRAFT_98127 [Scheffersomyces xylosifermentans]|uniref:uncharacterized protein n=1 Tax=Scheffersomyces xylosifermentans TaxID=1304137 RepID=UPI00315D4728